jgi:uncharacterized membrane protein/predicted DsbA family dithiol-disulfide isomerase
MSEADKPDAKRAPRTSDVDARDGDARDDDERDDDERDDDERDEPSVRPAPVAADDFGPLRVVLMLVLTAAIAAAAALTVDYTHATPTFCGEVHTGCGAVKQSAYAHLGPVPTPIIGLVGFAALVLTALLRGVGARRAFGALALVAACAGTFLLGAQYRMGQICKFCVVTDVASIVVAFIALHRLFKGWDFPPPVKPRVLWAATPTLAGLGLLLIGSTGAAPAPQICEPVDRLAESAPPGKVLVVDFTDFECPFCRQNHANLKPLLDANKEKFHVVRRHVPLQIHPGARGAARAAICAERLGKGDEYAELLLEYPTDDFIDFAFQKLARQVGLDEGKFRECLKDPEVEARIERDRADYKSCEGKGLPLIFLGGERLFGLRQPDELEAHVKRALSK